MKPLASCVLAVAALAGCGGRDEYSVIVFGRENSSGTYTYFKEHVLGGEAFGSNVEELPGTAAIVSAVMQDHRAVGYGGIAYLAGVRPLKIKKDGSTPAIGPTKESIEGGTYPLTRYLYLYTIGLPEGTAKSFIDWTEGEEGQRICLAVGYFPPSTQKLASPGADPPVGKTSLSIKGSDTMTILTRRWASRFMELHPGCSVQVTGGGSETGIAALKTGQTDICQSSRPLKPAEMDELKAKWGKSPVETKVALDGLAIFVNVENPVQEVSLAEAKSIFTGKVSRWGDLSRPAR